MGNFNRDDRSESRRDFGRKDFGRRSFSGHGGEREMHKVVCSSCGKDCEVPFRPTSGKPVYCQQCFKKSSDSDNKNTEQFKEQFDKLNAKLDQVLKALTPVFPKKVAKKRGFGKAVI